MILEYHRPETIETALTLLNRPSPVTLPLGGGSVLSQPLAHLRTPMVQPETPFAVVDIQALGLDQIGQSGRNLTAGAAVRLESLLQEPAVPEALRQALRLEASANLRNIMTLAGALVSSDGRSPLATVLLALDADLAGVGLNNKEVTWGLGDFLPLRAEVLRGRLITSVTFSLQARCAYCYSARTPADRPIIAAALAAWPSGRVRLVLGGFGPQPMLVLDGPEPGGLEIAARNAFAYAGDEWATAEYRSATAAELTSRCMQMISQP